MAHSLVDVETYGREFCGTCGMWSDHFWFPESLLRNKSGEPISVWVKCGWSGCGLPREERINR